MDSGANRLWVCQQYLFIHLYMSLFMCSFLLGQCSRISIQCIRDFLLGLLAANYLRAGLFLVCCGFNVSTCQRDVANREVFNIIQRQAFEIINVKVKFICPVKGRAWRPCFSIIWRFSRKTFGHVAAGKARVSLIKWMMAGLHLAPLVSGSWFCAWWLTIKDGRLE